MGATLASEFEAILRRYTSQTHASFKRRPGSGNHDVPLGIFLFLGPPHKIYYAIVELQKGCGMSTMMTLLDGIASYPNLQRCSKIPPEMGALLDH